MSNLITKNNPPTIKAGFRLIKGFPWLGLPPTRGWGYPSNSMKIMDHLNDARLRLGCIVKMCCSNSKALKTVRCPFYECRYIHIYTYIYIHIYIYIWIYCTMYLKSRGTNIHIHTVTYSIIQYILEYLHNHTWKALMSSVNRRWVRHHLFSLKTGLDASTNNCSHDWK